MTYANTIVVQEKYEALISGTWTDLTAYSGYYKNYYGKGVGLLKWEYYDLNGALDTKYELTRSAIY